MTAHRKDQIRRYAEGTVRPYPSEWKGALAELLADLDEATSELDRIRLALVRLSSPVIWDRNQIPSDQIGQWDASAAFRMYQSGRWHESFAEETLRESVGLEETLRLKGLLPKDGALTVETVRERIESLFRQWKEWANANHNEADKVEFTDPALSYGHRCSAEAIEQCADEMGSLLHPLPGAAE